MWDDTVVGYPGRDMSSNQRVFFELRMDDSGHENARSW
jgi:hypothetical protein